MKKIPFLLIMVLALGSVLTSCFKDDDEKIANDYAEWREANIAWFAEQTARIEGGSNYYTTVTAPWDPAAQVLIHWFNDTTKTKNNLKPKFSSMVDVKYFLRLYDGTPIDSSYLSTSPADSLFRCRLNSGVIEGWAIAIPKMHIGDSCRVIIPYIVGYGTTSSGDIKPFSTLQFDIKLVGIPKYEL
jgi:FKBP-type peptidyl-prolyl cis-trans isomerase FklB